jgi:hypothetical protein
MSTLYPDTCEKKQQFHSFVGSRPMHGSFEVIILPQITWFTRLVTRFLLDQHRLNLQIPLSAIRMAHRPDLKPSKRINLAAKALMAPETPKCDVFLTFTGLNLMVQRKYFRKFLSRDSTSRDYIYSQDCHIGPLSPAGRV